MIFPNPLTTQILNFSQSIENTIISIFNQNGQLIEQEYLESTKNYSLKNYLTSGNYFVHFENEQFTKTIQIIVIE